MLAFVYDGTGQTTFKSSLDCLTPRGLMVSYGHSTGELKGIDLGIPAAKESLSVTRPTLATYIATRDEVLVTANDLFGVVAGAVVKLTIGQRCALADTAEAHRVLEGRQTTGSTILVP